MDFFIRPYFFKNLKAQKNKGLFFIKYVMFTASAQNIFDSPVYNRMLLTWSFNVQLILLAISLSLTLIGTVLIHMILSQRRTSWILSNHTLFYYRILSTWLSSYYNSKLQLPPLKGNKHIDLCFRKQTPYTFMLKSSLKLT